MSENLGSGKQSAVSTSLDRAELAAVDDVAHALRERVVAVVERLHDDETRARRDRGNRFGFLRVRGERLLAQHVLARLERGDRPLRVQPVGQRVVDRVDVRIGDAASAYDSCTFAMPCFDANASARARSRAATADHLGFVDVARGFDHGRGRDARRAEDSDPNWAHRANCTGRHAGGVDRL